VLKCLIFKKKLGGRNTKQENFDKYKSGELCGQHIVSTCNMGTSSAFSPTGIEE
jgi:hypothetical protein